MKKKTILFSLIALFMLVPFFGFSQAQGGTHSLQTTYDAVKNAPARG